jgi:hypothetical protein
MLSLALTAIVLAAGLLCSSSGALYWQMALCLFGATAAITLPNGAVITPSNFFLPFLILRAWLENQGSRYMRRVPAAGVCLALAALCGILGALFIPRFLEGWFQILTVDREGLVSRPKLYPLHPVSANLTQSIYALGSVAAFLAVRVLLERPGRIARFRDAAFLLCALDCAAGLINLAEYHLGLPAILNYVRNAYSVFDTYAGTGGLVRIHGTFSEASAYASFTLPLFAFCFYLWLHHVRPLYSGALAATSGVLLLISTSSTAYVGIVIYTAVFLVSLTYRGYVRGRVPKLGLILAAALLSAAWIGALFVFETNFGRQLNDYFSVKITNKLTSESGMERSTWNQYAWLNFLETYGLGVGLGSARASSYALVLLSNLGLVGTVFYALFVVHVLRGPVAAEFDGDMLVCEAASQAMLAALSAALVSAAVYDMGVSFYAFAAAASMRAAANAHALAPSGYVTSAQVLGGRVSVRPP